MVNAATHRDYGIKGTDIQIKMFDDRLEVDSPGAFAGMVKKENIRYTHFSRNPKIAAFLKDYGYVKESGEGVDNTNQNVNGAVDNVAGEGKGSLADAMNALNPELNQVPQVPAGPQTIESL